MSRKSSLVNALVLLAGVAIGVGSASAQNALGTGRGLEKPLQQGGVGNVPRADFGAEVRFRNSLVTGNAPGGRSLRIDRPYGEVGDIQSNLGSDDLFSFRRDTLYSGLAGQGYRGTEGLQYQMGLTSGGRLMVERGGPGQAALVTSPRQQNVTQSQTRTQAWSVANTPTGSLRSTAAFSGAMSLRPLMLDSRTTDDGDREVTAASSLLGVRTIKQRRQQLGELDPSRPGELDTLRPGELEPVRYGDVAPPKKDEEQKRPLSASMPAGANGFSEPARKSARTAYDDLRVKLGRYGEWESAPKDGAEGDSKADGKAGDARGMRNPAAQIRGQKHSADGRENNPGERAPGDTARPRDGGVMPREGDRTTSQPPEPKPGDDANRTPGWERRMDDLRSKLQTPDRKKKDGKDEPTRELDRDTLDAIRAAGKEKTTTLVAPNPEWRDLFAEQLQAGEKAMSEEKYFDAEERFARGLSLKPGSVDAQIGRLNAQLAAGLYSSAAMNLRQLVTRNPEMAGMRFAGNVMPSAARQEKLIAHLRSNLKGEGPSSARVPKESALLLAYLGHQRGDAALVKEGLASLREQYRFEDTKWIDFLDGVWTPKAEDAAPATK